MSARAHRANPGLPPPDSMVSTLKFQRGGLCGMSVTFAGHLMRMSFCVVGTEGTLEASGGGWLEGCRIVEGAGLGMSSYWDAWEVGLKRGRDANRRGWLRRKRLHRIRKCHHWPGGCDTAQCMSLPLHHPLRHMTAGAFGRCTQVQRGGFGGGKSPYTIHYNRASDQVRRDRVST